MIDRLKQIINDGEGLTIEFKTCKNELSDSVFETVSSFSNRYGGYMLLGVQNDGKIVGVNPDKAEDMKHNFATALNNPNMMAPTLFIALEIIIIDGETILWCYIPPHSQVVMYNGRIFDRNNDEDLDITRNSEMVSQIHRRKAADFSERKVLPYINESDLEFDRLLPLVRKLAVNNREGHPWGKMDDKEIINSIGLYETDPVTGQSGYILAAVLLFGNEKLIRTCTSNYITDAICRKENVDRYDDRLRVTVNLIDAYDQLTEFIHKHTDDRFFLIGTQRVSARSWIAREIVSNVLMHREFSSALAAKIIIERDRIITENWNLPRFPGPLDPKNFTPYSKNPIIASFFANIGRADELGSGVRNLYFYTKMYSGKEPELIDGDMFRTIVPISSSNKNGIKRGTNGVIITENGMINVTEGLNDNVNDNNLLDSVDGHAIIINYLRKNGDISVSEAAKIVDCSHSTARRMILTIMEAGFVIPVGENRNRRYKIVNDNLNDK
jgi:ATP-dependent DNA helicase RecG